MNIIATNRHTGETLSGPVVGKPGIKRTTIIAGTRMIHLTNEHWIIATR